MGKSKIGVTVQGWVALAEERRGAASITAAEVSHPRVETKSSSGLVGVHHGDWSGSVKKETSRLL